jgi:hypothetical protein
MGLKKWFKGEEVQSNDNKFKGEVVETHNDGRQVDVDVDGYGKMRFGHKELKRQPPKDRR